MVLLLVLANLAEMLGILIAWRYARQSRRNALACQVHARHARRWADQALDAIPNATQHADC